MRITSLNGGCAAAADMVTQVPMHHPPAIASLPTRTPHDDQQVHNLALIVFFCDEECLSVRRRTSIENIGRGADRQVGPHLPYTGVLAPTLASFCREPGPLHLRFFPVEGVTCTQRWKPVPDGCIPGLAGRLPSCIACRDIAYILYMQPSPSRVCIAANSQNKVIRLCLVPMAANKTNKTNKQHAPTSGRASGGADASFSSCCTGHYPCHGHLDEM
jgi:hypothetical protein